MALWRILIGDKDSTNLHGVTLREDIKKLALDQKPIIVGQVRNIKNTGQVEVICIFGNEPKNFVKKIDDEIKSNDLIQEPAPIKTEEVKIDEIGKNITGSATFKIIREDELTEMMWALRYAGVAVLSQELVRGKNIIRALLAELITNQLMLNDESETKTELNTIAIESMIRHPYEKIDHKTLLTLQKIYSLCKSINKSSGEQDPITTDLIGQLKSEIEGILPPLKELAKRMRINIPENNNSVEEI